MVQERDDGHKGRKMATGMEASRKGGGDRKRNLGPGAGEGVEKPPPPRCPIVSEIEVGLVFLWKLNIFMTFTQAFSLPTRYSATTTYQEAGAQHARQYYNSRPVSFCFP